jgi:hypothetical protein
LPLSKINWLVTQVYFYVLFGSTNLMSFLFNIVLLTVALYNLP